MFKIWIKNLQKEKVNLRLLRKAISWTLREKLGDCQKEVSMVLVDNARIKELNKRFRGVKRATDVLAFSLGGEFISTKNLLGEVIISVEQAQIQAEQRGHCLEDELVLLAIHGILHLLGYNDEDEKEREVMEKEERKILTFLEINPEII